MSVREDAEIAVVGIACRLPGAPSPEAFWRLLERGGQAVGEVPAERWELAGREPGPGFAEEDKAARFGAFLDDVAGFDAAFFGISPREAAAMDPQQRLALELSWEAIEDAGVAAARLRGAAAGVFLGAIAGDYAGLAARAGLADRHLAAGLHRAMIANRVSYRLGLTGPSLAVDSAQSASLVAVHLACESLRRGESALALAGGVQINLDPASALASARLGALSPTGMCAPFDARADGYVRGEGGGVVLLKPLAAAEADGDRIYCTIRGSAVNNDGGGAALLAPSRAAQEAVLAAAYRDAGLDPAEARYVELHGTGTPVGDPVEAAALGAVLGAGRAKRKRLRVGSVKTNIGHLEGAAGIAGLIKTALAIDRGAIPRSLNFEQANPDIPLDELGIRVQGKRSGWPAGKPVVAGVSSFGAGGTNCHVVLASPPPASPGPSAGKRQAAGGSNSLPLALPLSARGEAALRAQAGRVAALLRTDDGPAAADVGRSLATDREAFEHRAVAFGKDAGEVLAGLDALAAGEPSPGLVEGIARQPAKPVFLFPGMGSQWRGMAVGLLERSTEFSRQVRACTEALEPLVGWALEDVLLEAGDAPGQERDDVAQLALFGVMVSLAGLWRAAGVEPAVVAGHSLGEAAAAYVAGGLSLEDAARVVVSRNRVLLTIVGHGAMASVAAPAEEIEERLSPWKARLSLAAINGPVATVVSGDEEALDELLESCKRDGLRARRIRGATAASHSPQVEPLRGPLLEELATISPRSGEIPFCSTVTGGLLDTTRLDAEYWYRNVRETVRLEPVLRSIFAGGTRATIEVSSHPVLGMSVTETAERVLGEGEEVAAVATLRRGEGNLERFLEAAAEAHVAGVAVDWPSLQPPGRRVPLPTYPFQRERHWLPLTAGGGEGLPVAPQAEEEPARTAGSSGGEWAMAIAALAEEERAARAAELVRGEVSRVLGQEKAPIDAHASFKDLGFDSLAAVELRNRLQAAAGVRLATTAVFDYPSSAAVAEHLLAKIGRPGAGADNGAAIETREREIRGLLETIPLSRLRSTGLLDSLLRLAGANGDTEPAGGGSADSIDAMNADELIRATEVGGSQGESTVATGREDD